MSDNITLPRETVVQAVKVLSPMAYDTWPRERNEVVEALRKALAAEQPKPEPVAWLYKGEPWFDGDCWHDNHQVTTSKQVAKFKDKNAQPLYTAPPATHPGYIIGSHWLETAYSRVCAGEAEADVLRDCGWERVDEALRRDAERWRHWRDSHGYATIDHEKGRCFVTLICDCDDPDQVRAKRFRGEDSFEWLDAFTDAAMEEGKR